ncbi:hypothetical protein Patl1_03373 [Pistacia atlantica]|uniref:Uncharacterized protein n=1 Tax=Pistacia atlantica TaxID=434234 RepID=A0ACC1CD05_9ROSI|nr:hypothetical protein Patl1_03373 [Pistacia atlantica]
MCSSFSFSIFDMFSLKNLIPSIMTKVLQHRLMC